MAAGWSFAGEGFPWLTVAEVRAAVDRFLAGSLVFLGLYLGGFLLLRRRGWTAATTAAIATALAAAPFGLAWAASFNRRRALRPRDLLEAHGLVPNLELLALFLGCLAVVCGVLVLWTRRRLLAQRRPPVAVTAVLAGVLAALHLASVARDAAGPAGPERPHVIILLVDALRADHLGSYGYERETSPAIDALARDGILFEQAISQSTFTKSSIASLFTGRAAYEHGVYWGDRRDAGDRLTSDVLPESEITLAEILRSRGYLTAAWVQNSHLRPHMGFAQGFVSYRDQQGDADRITGRFLRWLRGPARHHDVFAYLHYIDLHDPYLPEPPYDVMFGRHAPVYEGIDLAEWGAYLEVVRDGRETLSAAEVAQLEAYYDGQIRHLDDQIARLLDVLRREGRYDDTLIVLTSDHGDAFLEHGFISHSTTPYEELVRVPLIVKLPGNRHAGREVAAQVRLVDVMPTLLDLLGLAVPPEVAGCSLRPLWAEGGEVGRPPGCAEAVVEIAEEGAYPVVAIRAGGFKYIHHEHAGDELYDLASDPGETRNLIGAGLPAEERLRERALEVVAAREALSGERIELDEKTIRELKALGYLD